MKKLVIGASICLALTTTGCLSQFIASSLTPNMAQDVPQKTLEFYTENNAKVLDTLVTLSQKDIEDRNKAFKVLDNQANRIMSNGEPSTIDRLTGMVMSNAARKELEPAISGGLDWIKENIGAVAGGSAGGAGGIALLLRTLFRQRKKIQIQDANIDEPTRAKIRVAAKHTGLEKDLG